MGLRKNYHNASRGDRIEAQLFQIKLIVIVIIIIIIMLLNFFTQCARKFGKLINDHRTGKGQFHSVPKEGHCDGMLKLLHIHAHFICWQCSAQNSSI